jgi:MinD-like ATPase involved in chromosome partitioning or flagellar assembly
MTLVGAKGGAGTTTVALNVAAVLAQQRHKVTLVEMHPAFGTLRRTSGPRTDPNLSHLLEAAAIGPADTEACLWPCEKVPGLSVLFGPQTAAVPSDPRQSHPGGAKRAGCEHRLLW